MSRFHIITQGQVPGENAETGPIKVTSIHDVAETMPNGFPWMRRILTVECSDETGILLQKWGWRISPLQ